MENQTILLILFIIAGYLFGSIPFGYLIAKLKKIDIRKKGSGNIGGTNISRTIGFKYGILVSALDIIKAIIPIYIASRYLSQDWQMALVSISPVLGHIFPIWLRFKGGKRCSYCGCYDFHDSGLEILSDFPEFLGLNPIYFKNNESY